MAGESGEFIWHSEPLFFTSILSRQTIETKTVPEETYRKYPGGSALVAYLLLQAIPAGADPLGPDNVLVMAVTPPRALPYPGRAG